MEMAVPMTWEREQQDTNWHYSNFLVPTASSAAFPRANLASIAYFRVRFSSFPSSIALLSSIAVADTRSQIRICNCSRKLFALACIIQVIHPTITVIRSSCKEDISGGAHLYCKRQTIRSSSNFHIRTQVYDTPRRATWSFRSDQLLAGHL